MVNSTKQVPLVPGTFRRDEDSGGSCLVGSYCATCERVIFPKMVLCPMCHVETVERAIGRTAKLFSFTIAHVAPIGFEAPYFQAYVDLPEGPRVFTLISADTPVEPDSLREEMDLELVIEPVRVEADGTEITTYKYRPLIGGGAAQ